MLTDRARRPRDATPNGRAPIGSVSDLRLEPVGRTRWRVVDVRRSPQDGSTVVAFVSRTEAGFELTLADSPERRRWCMDLSSTLQAVVRASWGGF